MCGIMRGSFLNTSLIFSCKVIAFLMDFSMMFASVRNKKMRSVQSRRQNVTLLLRETIVHLTLRAPAASTYRCTIAVA